MIQLENCTEKAEKDRGLQDLQRKLVKSILEEYDQVSISETPKSKWVQQLLFRHLQRLLQYEVRWINSLFIGRAQLN